MSGNKTTERLFLGEEELTPHVADVGGAALRQISTAGLVVGVEQHVALVLRERKGGGQWSGRHDV